MKSEKSTTKKECRRDNEQSNNNAEWQNENLDDFNNG
jgi:hypothetical protein